MGKITNQRRKAWVAKIAAQDKAKAKPKPKAKPKKVEVNPCWCEKRHVLPTFFRRCIDCPNVANSVAGADNRQELANPPQG